MLVPATFIFHDIKSFRSLYALDDVIINIIIMQLYIALVCTVPIIQLHCVVLIDPLYTGILQCNTKIYAQHFI